jgi:signal peptidase I
VSAPAVDARPTARRVHDVLQALLVAILLALFVRTWLLQAFRIPTGSMEPNLWAGDHLLVNKFVYGPTLWAWERRLLPLRSPRRGDVIVFRFPREPARLFVKRVLGLPGEEVALEMRRLVVDGAPVDERGWARFADPSSYPDSGLLDPFYRRRDNFGPARVPRDAFFVLGDNRDFSADSRYWGFVPRERLLGRAWLVYLPLRSGDAASSSAPRSWRPLHLVR